MGGDLGKGSNWYVPGPPSFQEEGGLKFYLGGLQISILEGILIYNGLNEYNEKEGEWERNEKDSSVNNYYCLI